MFQFAEGATVALKNDIPGLNLKAGDTGIIWALYDMQPPMYEITFRDQNGHDFDMPMAEDEISDPAAIQKTELAHVS